MAKDAAEVSPRLIEDKFLLPRDNSGGIDYEPHAGEFGEAGHTRFPKDHLSVGANKKSKKDSD